MQYFFTHGLTFRSLFVFFIPLYNSYIHSVLPSPLFNMRSVKSTARSPHLDVIQSVLSVPDPLWRHYSQQGTDDTSQKASVFLPVFLPSYTHFLKLQEGGMTFISLSKQALCSQNSTSLFTHEHFLSEMPLSIEKRRTDDISTTVKQLQHCLFLQFLISEL